MKSEIRKVLLEGRDIPLHGDIFGMPISPCVSPFSIIKSSSQPKYHIPKKTVTGNLKTQTNLSYTRKQTKHANTKRKSQNFDKK